MPSPSSDNDHINSEKVSRNRRNNRVRYNQKLKTSETMYVKPGRQSVPGVRDNNINRTRTSRKKGSTNYEYQDTPEETSTNTHKHTNTSTDTHTPTDTEYEYPSDPERQRTGTRTSTALPIPMELDGKQRRAETENSSPIKAEPIPPFHNKRDLTLYTLNVRGMSSSIGDLSPMMTQYQPEIVALTETKHKGVKPIWRHALHGYKLIHKPLDTAASTNRKRGGSILAIKQSAFKNIEALDPPAPLHNYIAAALKTPHAGKQILAVSAYMPQLHLPSDKANYTLCIQWILDHAQHPNRTCYIGGDFQASPAPNIQGNARILRELLRGQLLDVPLNDPLTPTFQPARSPVDH